MSKRFFVSLLMLVLLAGLVSAGNFNYNYNGGDDYTYKETISKTYYNSEKDYALTRTIYVSYDNEDRYSTHDYRWGYSYRNSEDYWRRHHDYNEVKDVLVIRDSRDYLKKDYDMNYYRKSHDSGYYDRWRYYDEAPRTQVRYNKYMKRYEYRECYDYPPRGNLFYMAC